MGKQTHLTVLIITIIIATIGELLFSLTPDQRTVVRRYESETKKLNNVRNAVVFNELCIKENLLPKYSNINLHDRAVQHEDFVTDFRKRLTSEQLSRKKDLLKKLAKDQWRRIEFPDGGANKSGGAPPPARWALARPEGRRRQNFTVPTSSITSNLCFFVITIVETNNK